MLGYDRLQLLSRPLEGHHVLHLNEEIASSHNAPSAFPISLLRPSASDRPRPYDRRVCPRPGLLTKPCRRRRRQLDFGFD